MKESDIQKKIIHFLKTTFDGVVVWKLSDAFNRGRPDLVAFFSVTPSVFALVGAKGYIETVFIEVKQPGGKTTALQQKTLDDLSAMGGHCLIATSVVDVDLFLAEKGLGVRKKS